MFLRIWVLGKLIYGEVKLGICGVIIFRRGRYWFFLKMLIKFFIIKRDDLILRNWYKCFIF